MSYGCFRPRERSGREPSASSRTAEATSHATGLEVWREMSGTAESKSHMMGPEKWREINKGVDSTRQATGPEHAPDKLDKASPSTSLSQEKLCKPSSEKLFSGKLLASPSHETSLASLLRSSPEFFFDNHCFGSRGRAALQQAWDLFLGVAAPPHLTSALLADSRREEEGGVAGSHPGSSLVAEDGSEEAGVGVVPGEVAVGVRRGGEREKGGVANQGGSLWSRLRREKEAEDAAAREEEKRAKKIRAGMVREVIISYHILFLRFWGMADLTFFLPALLVSWTYF